MNITFLSHSAFLLNIKEQQILIDPFIENNPMFSYNVEQLKPDYIILSHAHGDHLGSTIDLAKKHNCIIIAVNELANYLSSEGCKVHNMHIGGSYNFPFGKVKFTIAHHGSSNAFGQYMGEPAGILLFLDKKILYHAGDTGLFYDMKIIGEFNKIDLAILPIGDNYTMGIDDAVIAAKYINASLTVPMHYNTFPIINADPFSFLEKLRINGLSGRVLNINETIEL